MNNITLKWLNLCPTRLLDEIEKSVFMSQSIPWSTDLDEVIPDVVFTLQLQLFASDLPLNQSEYTADTLSSNQNRVDHRKLNFSVIFTLHTGPFIINSLLGLQENIQID